MAVTLHDGLYIRKHFLKQKAVFSLSKVFSSDSWDYVMHETVLCAVIITSGSWPLPQVLVILSRRLFAIDQNPALCLPCILGPFWSLQWVPAAVEVPHHHIYQYWYASNIKANLNWASLNLAWECQEIHIHRAWEGLCHSAATELY